MIEQVREIAGSAAPGQTDNVIREYLQARILGVLQERGAWQSIAFMGGTALRFLYGTPRFSEDLDFTLEGDRDSFDLHALADAIRGVFEREGYTVAVKTATKSSVHKAVVRFAGLRYALGLSPHPDEALAVKIEVDTDPPQGAAIDTTTVRQFVTLRLSHHDRASLLAGKIAAVLLREWVKGRDVYDLVWYLSGQAWPEPNETRLAASCRQAGHLELCESGAWRAALVGRLTASPWEHVLSDVERFLERPEDAWMVDRENVMRVLKQRGWCE